MCAFQRKHPPSEVVCSWLVYCLRRHKKCTWSHYFSMCTVLFIRLSNYVPRGTLQLVVWMMDRWMDNNTYFCVYTIFVGMGCVIFFPDELGLELPVLLGVVRGAMDDYFYL